MKNKLFFCLLVLFAGRSLTAQMTVSGILDSTVALRAGAGDSPSASFGIEEFANIRFQSRLRERGTVTGAINLTAASGLYALPLGGIGFTVGDNFIASLELERLHFRLRGEHIDFDGGLFRLPFGYSQVWGSSDYLNPKNPLKPDARPRAILGAALTWFPIDELKLQGFYAAPRDVLEQEGKGSLFGLSLDHHWDKASLQTLYSFETPKDGSAFGIHRAGVSLKFDIKAGFVLDTLYTYNHEAGTELDGLSFSFGVDYSFFDGNLIVLAEYLYNGETSSTALDPERNIFGFSNNHYLYTSLTWRFSDLTNMSVAVISGFDDISFTPVVSVNHDLFQGAVLTITMQAPLDRDLFTGNGKRGELGPIPPDQTEGSYFSCTVRLRLRF